MKKYFFLLLSVIALNTFSQIEDPVDWSFSVEHISNQSFNLIIEAEIEEGWNVYSQYVNPDGPVPTSFYFVETEEYELIDGVEESNSKTKYDPVFQMDLSSFQDKAIFKQKIKILNDTTSVIRGELEFMVCNATMCLPPDYVDMIFEVKKKTENSLKDNSSSLLTFKSDSNKYIISSIDLNNPIGDCGQKKSEKSLWGIFFLGIIGGFIALLTPCVFPMIPLTVSFFTKGSEDKRKAIYNAAIYGLFIFLTYTLLSLPFHLMPNINPEVFNQISTNPWLNIGFFLIFIVFAISFFGYFEITLPSSWSNSAGSGSNIGGVLGIFFMALTLAIVSFSCTGPILGSLLAGTLSSATADLINIFGFSTALVAVKLSLAMAGFGLALGLPFALFAAFPTWLKSLPKSGGWLNTVKVILGFIEIALAIKFLSNADLVEQWGVIRREVFFALWVLTFLALALYIFGLIKFPHDSQTKKISFTSISFGAAVVAFVIYLFPGVIGKDWWSHKLLSGFPPPKYYSYINYEHQIQNIFHDYEEGLLYAQQVNKPIMIDFTGWACVNCRKIEDDVWVEKRVKTLLNNDYVVISLYVDEKTDLAEDEKEVIDIITRDGKVKKKKIKRIGDKWSTLQSLTFANNTQPLHVLMTPDEQLLANPVGYSYARNANNYVEYLECGINAFHTIGK
jgi:thiol:disulfide interchange protein